MVNAIVNRMEKYDPIAGRFVRDIKPNDIVQAATTSGTTPSGAGDFTLCSITTDANTQVYIYHLGVGATGATFFVAANGTSTQLVQYLSSSGQLVQNAQVPIAKIDVSTTFSLIAKSATTTGTYTGFIVGVREPILTKVEM